MKFIFIWLDQEVSEKTVENVDRWTPVITILSAHPLTFGSRPCGVGHFFKVFMKKNLLFCPCDQDMQTGTI